MGLAHRSIRDEDSLMIDDFTLVILLGLLVSVLAFAR
jgi:hypothetical protein